MSVCISVPTNMVRFYLPEKGRQLQPPSFVRSFLTLWACYNETCLERHLWKDHLVGKDHFPVSENVLPPLESMQTENVCKDLFSRHQGWLFQTGFTALIFHMSSEMLN